LANGSLAPDRFKAHFAKNKCEYAKLVSVPNNCVMPSVCVKLAKRLHGIFLSLGRAPLFHLWQVCLCPVSRPLPGRERLRSGSPPQPPLQLL